MVSEEKWRCYKNCKESREKPNEPCPHLEKFLPDLKQRYRAFRDPNIDRYAGPEEETQHNEFALQNRLKKLGFDHKEIELIMSRIWDNYSWEDIATTMKYTNATQAELHWNILLEKLRKVGIT